MCGIAGIVRLGEWDRRDRAFLCHADAALASRGPDASRVTRIDANVSLLHRRLAIIDLGGSAQPASKGDQWLTYNGEIYNFRELAAKQGTSTQSDTEFLLEFLMRGGLSRLADLDGMFAFAFYDRASRRLFLVRDRFGIKPLYYVIKPEAFYFASTIRALMPISSGTIDANGLSDFYRYRAARGARTLFADIKELEAGSVLTLDVERAAIINVRRWVDPTSEVRENFLSDAEALEAIDVAIRRSVRRHLVSDVPVCSFLSGGVDSSIITTIAAKECEGLEAFVVGFDDAKFDETAYASAVARACQIKLNVLRATSRDVLGELDAWLSNLDDPLGEPSGVFLYALAKLARSAGFKVALMGEGADELFGGYNTYQRYKAAWDIRPFGAILAPIAAMLAHALPAKARLVHYANVFSGKSNFEGSGIVFEPHFAKQVLNLPETKQPTAMTIREALDHDIAYRLPDDALCKADRATMAASIEGRVPFLTSYVHEVSRRVADDMLIRGRTKKYILKKYAETLVPREVIYRPKMGFSPPLAAWLRGPLRERLLDVVSRTWQRQYFVEGTLDKMVRQHLKGHADHSSKLFSILVADAVVASLKGYASGEGIAPLSDNSLVSLPAMPA